MTKKQETKDWTTKFIEKNAWALLMVLASLIYFFGSFFSGNSSTIEALAKDVDRVEEAIVIIADNQDKILVLQEKQSYTDENIIEIKEDIRDIKKALNIL